MLIQIGTSKIVVIAYFDGEIRSYTADNKESIHHKKLRVISKKI